MWCKIVSFLHFWYIHVALTSKLPGNWVDKDSKSLKVVKGSVGKKTTSPVMWLLSIEIKMKYRRFFAYNNSNVVVEPFSVCFWNF